VTGLPSTPGTVDFWFEFASTYSYPAAMTVADRAAERGVRVRWRPFLLGPIFAAQGWTTSPFNLQPAKGAYMWRDMARICAREGLPFRRPEPFPQHTVRAARLALIGAGRAWGPAFVRAVYRAEFADGADLSEVATLRSALEGAGADAASCLEEAESPAIKQALRDAVAEAQSLGIFGAPSFVAGGELWWGSDRMADALAAAAGDSP